MPINLTITADNVIELQKALRELADLTSQGSVVTNITPDIKVDPSFDPQAVAHVAAEAVKAAYTSTPESAQPEPTAPVGQAAPTTPAPAAVPTAPPAAPAPAPAPVSSPAPGPAAVPTSTQTYTLDQLAVAATQLVDAGRREELVQLLASFGVQALTALPKEQYGAFATALRQMGAKI